MTDYLAHFCFISHQNLPTSLQTGTPFVGFVSGVPLAPENFFCPADRGKKSPRGQGWGTDKTDKSPLGAAAEIHISVGGFA